MNFVVLSDTHGNYPLALRAIEKAGPVDGIIHLGDDIDDAYTIETVLERPVIKVPGNCDLKSSEPREIIETFHGVRILITHGDRYTVKSSLTLLRRKAVEYSVHAVLYGHTHKAAAVDMGRIIYVNPGCLSYNCRTPGFAILSVLPGHVFAQLMTIGP